MSEAPQSDRRPLIYALAYGRILRTVPIAALVLIPRTWHDSGVTTAHGQTTLLPEPEVSQERLSRVLFWIQLYGPVNGGPVRLTRSAEGKGPSVY